MRGIYPHDCSDACPKQAVWDIEYTDLSSGRPRKVVMGACAEHEESVTRAALVSAWRGEVTTKPHKI